jgi:hypothetical protein
MSGQVFHIAKQDGLKNLVFGWANVAIKPDGEQIVDFQEDMVDIADLEQAAYEFNLYYRGSGEMHEGEEVVGHMIESFMVTPEKLSILGLSPDALPLGWWVGFHIPDDAVMEKVKSGQYKMFSIQGSAKRKPVATFDQTYGPSK